MAILSFPKFDKEPDYDNPANPENAMDNQPTDAAELKARCDRFRTTFAPFLNDAKNPYPMVIAGNFLKSDLNDLINENADSQYVRVYYGIKEDGKHGFFMLPVAPDGDAKLAATTRVLDASSHCPPLGNCPKDSLLKGQPSGSA